MLYPILESLAAWPISASVRLRTDQSLKQSRIGGLKLPWKSSRAPPGQSRESSPPADIPAYRQWKPHSESASAYLHAPSGNRFIEETNSSYFLSCHPLINIITATAHHYYAELMAYAPHTMNHHGHHAKVRSRQAQTMFIVYKP